MDDGIVWLKSDESLDDLILGGMKIIQPVHGYRFSLDAVLLAHFVELSGVNKIIDLGTGNGIIPILLAVLAPGPSITGVEIQPVMVDRARRSIDLNGLTHRIAIIQGDIRQIDKLLARGSADLVLSNPPFWKQGEGHLSNNAEEANARHELTLNLTELVDRGAYLLRPGGRMTIIQRAERLEEALELFRCHQLYPKRLRLVHSYVDRKASLYLLEGMKNRPGRLEILAPLVIYEKPGKYTEEITQYYGGT
jgi:Predicted O-methyltransferase